MKKKNTLMVLFTLLIICAMNPFTKAQAPEQISYSVTCNCRMVGYGCGANPYCKMYCSHQCHLHHVIPGREVSSLSDETSLIDIDQNSLTNSSTISFALTKSENVSVKIYDVTGRLVKTLADNVLKEGENELTWDFTFEKQNTINKGMYFLHFDTEIYSETKLIPIIN